MEDALFNRPDHTQVSEALRYVLADTYLLYLKTQNFHWNVTGPFFFPLHQAFEAQYRELAEAVDEIAERIRALGARAPASLGEFSELSEIEDARHEIGWHRMIEMLVGDHELVCQSLEEGLDMAKAEGDDGTADLMIRRLQAHQKTIWMLASMSDTDFAGLGKVNPRPATIRSEPSMGLKS